MLQPGLRGGGGGRVLLHVSSSGPDHALRNPCVSLLRCQEGAQAGHRAGRGLGEVACPQELGRLAMPCPGPAPDSTGGSCARLPRGKLVGKRAGLGEAGTPLAPRCPAPRCWGQAARSRLRPATGLGLPPRHQAGGHERTSEVETRSSLRFGPWFKSH